MSENEQKAEPTAPPGANDQPVPKIDFGIDERPHTTPSAGQSKDMGAEKNSASDTKPQAEKDGTPAKDSESSQRAEPTKDPEAKSEAEANKNAGLKKNTGPGNDDESNKKLQSDVERRFEQQLTVNRKLATMLEEQLDLLLSMRRSMLAIQKTLEGTATSKKKLEKALETVKDGAEGLSDIHWINRVRGTLAMLQRSGMV